MVFDFLKFSSRITVLPILHGSGDFAIEVRRVMLSQQFDCLAVPLPPSFQHNVERAIGFLPNISVVLQLEPHHFQAQEWKPDTDHDDDHEEEQAASYVPIDP